jgi:hypothetical protein
MIKRWFDTGYLRAKPQEVDTETGIVKGVKVCSAGEAKGHGVSLDSDFIQEVTNQGNALQKGLKARFGHPNMCSDALGSFVGRFKNFTTGTTTREDGSEAACCFADLHLSETAKDTPNGDLYTYILGMAENEADVFGTSIVFHRGEEYRKNDQGEKIYPYDRNGNRNQEYREAGGPVFVECKKLCACDCVDEPAANDGLFSAFSGETAAGQITEFLDLHPQVFEILNDNPDVMKAIALHGDRFDEFLQRYTEYKQDGKTPAISKTKEVLTMENEENGPEVKTLEVEKTKTTESVEFGTVVEGPDVKAEVQAALKVDRARQTEIRELGSKFGFSAAAEKFANSDQTADEFRKHILNKSPEDWRSSLSIKNPAHQDSEQEFTDNKEGADAVEKIKASRRA